MSFGIPDSLFYNEDMTPTERFVGLFILTHPERANPKDVMTALNLSNKTVITAFAKMVSAGYLIREGRYRWKPAETEATR